MRPIVKTKILIFQLNANLDGKSLFGKITHHLDPDMRKMLEGGMSGNGIPYSDLVHHFYLLLQLRFYFGK